MVFGLFIDQKNRTIWPDSGKIRNQISGPNLSNLFFIDYLKKNYLLLSYLLIRFFYHQLNHPPHDIFRGEGTKIKNIFSFLHMTGNPVERGCRKIAHQTMSQHMLGLFVGLQVGNLGRKIFTLIARVAYTLVHGFLVHFQVGYGGGLMTADIARVFNSFVQGYIFSRDESNIELNIFFFPIVPKLEKLGLINIFSLTLI